MIEAAIDPLFIHLTIGSLHSMSRLTKVMREAVISKINSRAALSWAAAHDFPPNPVILPTLFQPHARKLFLMSPYLPYETRKVLVERIKITLGCDSSTLSTILLIGSVEYNVKNWIDDDLFFANALRRSKMNAKTMLRVSSVRNSIALRNRIATSLTIADVPLIAYHDPLLLEVKPLLDNIIRNLENLITVLPPTFLEKYLSISYNKIVILCSHPWASDLPPKLSNCVALLTGNYSLLKDYKYDEEDSLRMARLLSYIPKPSAGVILHLSGCVRLSVDWLPYLTQPSQLANMAANCGNPSAVLLLVVVRDITMPVEIRCEAVRIYSRHYSIKAVFGEGRLGREDLHPLVADCIREVM